MQSLLATRRSTALYLLVWAFIGGEFGVLIALSTAASWANSMLFAIPPALLYALAIAYSVYFLCRAHPLAEKGPVRIALMFAIASAISGTLWTIGAHLWNMLCLAAEVPWAGIVLDRPLSALVFGLGTVLYALSGIVHYLIVEFERTQVAEQRELESRLFAQDAELRMLRTQIDPHFLFNSLNSISALTSQDPAAARQMTLKLADFLRQSLGLSGLAFIPLEQELRLARNFLGIEQVRFGERLVIEEAIDEAALACPVPPLIIQPLVENAVKHGISQLTEGGTIRISAERAGSILRIRITNSVDDELPASGRKGIGLDNVCQRLEAAYREQATIFWAKQGGSFVVNLAMPAGMPDA